ncbi:YutD family protein [Paenibacillus sp. Y412MC10]|uniref:YutD family protein n=1 Tax=Geobacillus sp. (strain Y412MC10) TaxID=481743 RepID=UPI0011A76B02|nr:YutD family protein [Paenibacillus sp. Y412MC10]
MILIGGKNYEVLKDHKDGWNLEAFRERYSEVLDRYDYIVGDWGYSQLRLKGFYRDKHPKATKDTAISGMMDYINEYCNFGCAYFVLQKSRESQLKEKTKSGSV